MYEHQGCLCVHPRAPWESLRGCKIGHWVYLFLRNSFRGTLSERVSSLLRNSYIYCVINEWEITGTDLDGAIHMVKTGFMMWVFPGWFWQGQRGAAGPGISKGSLQMWWHSSRVWPLLTKRHESSWPFLGLPWLAPPGVMHQGAMYVERPLQYPQISATNVSSLVLVFSL